MIDYQKIVDDLRSIVDVCNDHVDKNAAGGFITTHLAEDNELRTYVREQVKHAIEQTMPSEIPEQLQNQFRELLDFYGNLLFIAGIMTSRESQRSMEEEFIIEE